MEPRPDPWLRFILAHLEHTSCRLDLGPDAPAGDKRARERGIGEVDRDGVIQHAARSRRRHRPSVRAAVLVEPGGDLRVPLTETRGGTATLMRTGKRRSAAVIISRGLPGIMLLFLSVMRWESPVNLNSCL